RDPHVQRLALAHERVQSRDGLLDRRDRVHPVRVEDVDVVEPHARQRLLGARDDVLAAREVAVWSRPHVPAGFRGDDELVAVGPQILREDAAEVLLRRSVGRTVVVRQIEVRDTPVERVAQERALVVERDVVAEVPPQAQRDRRQVQPGGADATEARPVVTGRCGRVGPVYVGNVGAEALFGHRLRLAVGLSARM
ncbi:hypothetical protein ABE10_02925, partial [Bacillus toyonensis]|nr:hypothetical protein [Bacillus toyonensis]